MKLRYYAAITTGCLVFIAAAAAQWIWTQRPIEDVFFIAILAYFIGAGIALVATEPRRKQPRRKHRARPIGQPEQECPTFVTLNKEEW